MQRSVTFHMKLGTYVAPRGLWERELVVAGGVNQKSVLLKLLVRNPLSSIGEGTAVCLHVLGAAGPAIRSPTFRDTCDSSPLYLRGTLSSLLSSGYGSFSPGSSSPKT